MDLVFNPFRSCFCLIRIWICNCESIILRFFIFSCTFLDLSWSISGLKHVFFWSLLHTNWILFSILLDHNFALFRSEYQLWEQSNDFPTSVALFWIFAPRRGSCHVNHFGFTSGEPPKTQYTDFGVNASNFVWSWKPYPTTLLFLSNHGSFGFSCFWIDEIFVCSCFCQISFVPRPVRFFVLDAWKLDYE